MRVTRNEVCSEPGQAPCDVVIDPADFVDFEKVLEGEESRLFVFIRG